MRRILAAHFVLYYVGNEFIQIVETIPAMPCFERFRKGDCKKEPVTVYYYEQETSRCQIGGWRGCLPALNMFDSEEECAAMCIGMKKPWAADYHKVKKFKDNLLKNEVAAILQPSATSPSLDEDDNSETESDSNETSTSGDGEAPSSPLSTTSSADADGDTTPTGTNASNVATTGTTGK